MMKYICVYIQTPCQVYTLIQNLYKYTWKQQETILNEFSYLSVFFVVVFFFYFFLFFGCFRLLLKSYPLYLELGQQNIFTFLCVGSNRYQNRRPTFLRFPLKWEFPPICSLKQANVVLITQSLFISQNFTRRKIFNTP